MEMYQNQQQKGERGKPRCAGMWRRATGERDAGRGSREVRAAASAGGKEWAARRPVLDERRRRQRRSIPSFRELVRATCVSSSLNAGQKCEEGLA